MLINELDVVQLRDGRAATVLAAFDNGNAYLVEVTDEHGKTLDMPTVTKSDIEKIVWRP